MSANDFRFWVWLFVVVFLFYGEPDVWDRLHEKAMSMEIAK
jgi:hypothetical protein